MPSVTATAACLGFRPVANAFGVADGMTKMRGIGRPALRVSRSDHLVDRGELLARDRLRPVRHERDAVGEPVREEVEDEADRPEEEHPAGAADHLAADREDRDQERHQHGGLHVVAAEPGRAGASREA